jgi:hypothetical protein
MCFAPGVGNLGATVFHVPSCTFLHCKSRTPVSYVRVAESQVDSQRSNGLLVVYRTVGNIDSSETRDES